MIFECDSCHTEKTLYETELDECPNCGGKRIWFFHFGYPKWKGKRDSWELVDLEKDKTIAKKRI